MSEEKIENILSAKQLKEHFHVSSSTISKWRREGLKMTRLGNGFFCMEQDFLEWFKNRVGKSQ